MWTVCTIAVWRLWNNKHELLLAVVVPILFFSVFALIFSRGVGQSTLCVRVAFVDDDQTPESRAVLRAVTAHPEIKPLGGLGRTSEQWSIERLSRHLISRRDVEVVVHVPRGFTTQDPDHPHLSIGLHDGGMNPIGNRVVEACLAEAIAMQFSELAVASTRGARPQFELAGHSRVAQAVPQTTATATVASAAEPKVFTSTSAFANNKHQPKIAMYAAGIAVMFLLFSASGAGASLLEEREAGTLDRLLNSRLQVGQLLLGKWFYMTGLGCAQLLVMFAWGQLVFQVDLLGHLPGFAAMTAATAAASASFALFLAACCRSRQQLQGVSIILILTMSAVGGSMVPRYVMSASMQSLGKFTFNGWALDGFQKVFWYDLPLAAIRLELLVLVSLAILLGGLARVLAGRWSVV